MKTKLLLAICLLFANIKPMESCGRVSVFLAGGSLSVAGAIGFIHNLACMVSPDCNNNDTVTTLIASVACFIGGSGLLGEAFRK